MQPKKSTKTNAIGWMLILFTILLFINDLHAQYIGSVTCFNDKERAGGESYPYNQSLFLSTATEAEWWDNLVEEIDHSGIDFSALLCRGYSPGRPSMDMGDPRKIPNMIQAMDRRKLGNNFKLAIFDDCPAGWTANHNYDQGRGHNTNTLFDCGDPNNYKYIWDYNLKISIENIPDSKRFKIDGRMVIIFWSVKPKWMTNTDNGNLKRILEHIRAECQKEFGFNPYLVVQDCWFDNDSQLKASDVEAVHNWFSAANGRSWSLQSVNNRKIGVVAPGFGYEGDPNHPFIDSNHGQTLINGLEATAKAGALITLCEGFTDAAETASYWRSKDETYYDYPNQRLNLLRRYSRKAFSNKRLVQAEACDFFYDRSPGNEGGLFREGDLDIQKTSDAFGGWNVFNAEAGEWLEWKELPVPEKAQFEIRYACQQPAQIQIMVDDQAGAFLSLAPTGGDQLWANARDSSFLFPQNTYKNVKIKVISGSVSLNYFHITGQGSSGFLIIDAPGSGARYLQTDSIPVKAMVTGLTDGIHKFELYVDDHLIFDAGASKLEHFLTDLSLGNHSIKLKAIQEDGSFSTDSCEIYIGSNSYTIRPTIVGEGEIIFDPPGGTYVEGSLVSVRAQPTATSFFNGWTGDLTSSANALTLTVNADLKLTANFLVPSSLGIKINFQPEASPVPEGYLKDAGLAYGLRDNGSTYGWIDGPNNATRDRGAPADNRYATLNHLQLNGNRTWEMQIENGSYRVVLVMGDPSFSNQTNNVKVEGILKEDPGLAGNFDEYQVVVTVTDNRLSISPGEGADNAKICFVEVSAVKFTQAETAASGAAGFELKQNVPNPFNDETTISFKLGKTSHTLLTVYNSFGQIIKPLLDQKMQAGIYQVSFDAAHLPPGIYFCHLRCGDFAAVRKMLLSK